jgi:serine/threonine protein kinase
MAITRPLGSASSPITDDQRAGETRDLRDVRSLRPGAAPGLSPGLPPGASSGSSSQPGLASARTFEGPLSYVAPADRAATVAVPAPASEPGPASMPAPATPAAAADGLMLGRYRLVERIGEGGMAEIFIAAAHGAEGFVRQFVVKRMHAHLARNRDAVNQFIDEARLQSGLVHSNIVPVFDFGRAGDEYFLALEYIHGCDLERLVRRHVEVFGRSLTVPVSFYIMHEVLDALAYAHGRHDQEGKTMAIVHRDVAPGNILVSLRGEVKLSDFGIAKAEGRVSRTELGMIKGNVSFMSPEQARGESVDHRSDLFSAAVVLYYCLTAQFLYRDETMFNRLVRAAIGPAMSEFTQLDELPPIAAGVLKKALSLDPGKRYQSAREFGRDLAGHFTAGRSELADLMETLFPELQRQER